MKIIPIGNDYALRHRIKSVKANEKSKPISSPVKATEGTGAATQGQPETTETPGVAGTIRKTSGTAKVKKEEKKEKSEEETK